MQALCVVVTLQLLMLGGLLHLTYDGMGEQRLLCLSPEEPSLLNADALNHNKWKNREHVLV